MSSPPAPTATSSPDPATSSPVHLLASIQHLLQTTYSLTASYHHSLSQLTTRLHTLDERTTRVLNEQHRLRLGLEWLREKGQLLPSSPLPTPAPAAAATDLTQTLFALFTQPPPAFTSRPFSYHTEQCYRRLLAYVRRRPEALVPAALAEVSGAVLAEQRRWLGGLCRGLVCDVMGDGRGVGAGDGDAAAGGDSGAGAVRLIEATLVRMQAVMRRRTERRRTEEEDTRNKEREREDAHRRQPTPPQPPQPDPPDEHMEDDSPAAPAPTSLAPALTITTTHTSPTSILSSSTSDIPILPPLHAFSVLDHSSLPLKLLHEFNLRYGQRYLQATLVSSLQLVLDEQHVDLNIDLMGPSPRGTGAGAGEAVGNAGGGGAGEKLFGICGHLMDAIVSSAAAMPPGMRRLARLLFRLGSAASFAPASSTASTTGLMASPSSPYRLVSDYLFLNYLINALMHPSSYSLLPLSAPPLSPLHRRNLQVVATVLIKVMSGSRFVFEGGRLQQLNEAVEGWRERVICFVDGLVEDGDGELGVGLGLDGEDGWSEGSEWAVEEEGGGLVGEGSDEVVDRVIAMLPNDLFCLHWLLLGWKREEVERGRAQRQVDRERRRATPALHSPTSSSTSLSPLVALLVQMDDPPPYLSLAENLYILLSSGFPTLAVPSLPPFTSSSRTERLCADMLSYVLSLLPRIMPPSTSSSAASVLTVLAAEAQRAESTGNAATAITITECIALLSATIPPPTTSLTPFLTTLHTHLTHYHTLLTASPLPSRLLLCGGEVERRQEELKRQEADVRDGLRGLGVRRVMEMVRVRVKRLRKFLAQRSDREKDKSAAGQDKPANGQLLDLAQQTRDRKASAPASLPLSTPPPPAYLATLLTGGGCSGAWPADVQADRFLCASCMRLLDKRRVLLRSFYNKYVIGEPGTAVDTNHTLSINGTSSSPTLAAPASLAAAISSPAALSTSTQTPHTTTPPTTATSTSATATVGTEPGYGHTLLNLSLGPPLSLLDGAVMCDLNDLICAAVWDEVWVECERGERQWWVECEALRQQLLVPADGAGEGAGEGLDDGADGRLDSGDVMRRAFEVWYALMALGEREVGGDSGVTVADIRRRLLQTHQPTTADNAAQQPLQRKLQQLNTPWLSTHTVHAFERELYAMLHSKSCRDKLDCIGRMRSIVYATLASGSMIALRRHQQATDTATTTTTSTSRSGSQADAEPEAGSVDDYMSMLSFLLVWLNPLGLLPHLSFLRLLHVPAGGHKAMVDVLTAVKYIYFTQQTVGTAKAGAAGAAAFALQADGLRQRAMAKAGRPESSVDGNVSGGAGVAGVIARSSSQPTDMSSIGGRNTARSLSSLDE